jgi:RimJ/RimL family protein N-acetyltransferase
MLYICKKFSELDFDQLMAVYEESNRENGSVFFPDDSPRQQLTKAEQEFGDYLRRDFFSVRGAYYCIWAENGVYLSALRLEPYMDGFLLCALETKLSARRKGHASALLKAVLDEVDLPVYSHIRKDNRASIAVHRVCGFRLHHEGARFLDGSVSSNSDTYIYMK